MSGDVVERLRETCAGGPECKCTLNEAASIITSQAAEIDSWRRVAERLETEKQTAERMLAEARAALTPSAETKAAYSGEFTIAVERHVNDDDEVDDETDGAGDPYEHIMVPWTTIKEIMAAISALTLTNGGESGR